MVVVVAVAGASIVLVVVGAVDVVIFTLSVALFIVTFDGTDGIGSCALVTLLVVVGTSEDSLEFNAETFKDEKTIKKLKATRIFIIILTLTI